MPADVRNIGGIDPTPLPFLERCFYEVSCHASELSYQFELERRVDCTDDRMLILPLVLQYSDLYGFRRRRPGQSNGAPPLSSGQSHFGREILQRAVDVIGQKRVDMRLLIDQAAYA